MHELPLLLFTLLVQSSVGLTFFLMLSTGAKCCDVISNRKVMLPALFVACVLGGLGLLASTLHLGYPLNAFHALRHVESSWLSREIVFASIYLAVLGLCTLAVMINKRPWKLLLPVATLAGLTDVWCMSAIYYHTSVVTWQHINTWVMFYGSTAILGAVAVAGLVVLRLKTPRTLTLVRAAAVLVIAVAVIRLLVQPDYIACLAQRPLSDVVTLPHQPLEAFHSFGTLRLCSWVLSVAGTLLFTLGVWNSRKIPAVFGGGLLVAGEILFRFMFFSIH